MRRLLFFALFVVLGFTLSAQRAVAAIYEFCPADVNSAPVAPAADGSARLYGFQLSALGPRTVSATVAFDTNAGWFTVNVPSSVLSTRERHYTGAAASFVQRDWASTIMYVRFPKPLKVEHRWVVHARATGDDLGWEARGNVQCEPHPEESNLMPGGLPSFDKDSLLFTTPDKDALDASPVASSLVLPALTSPPLKTGNCAVPFADATIAKMPSGFETADAKVSVGWTAAVEVALQPDGTVAGVWLWAPSGRDDLDNFAVSTARFQKYSAGRAYCAPAPGLYLLTIKFPPDFGNSGK